MRKCAQRFSWAASRAAAVLVAGVLLMQQVPVGPLAQQGANGPHAGCTEQACHCGADCACAHCEHHGDATPTGGADVDEWSGSGDGLTLRSCGTPTQGPTGVFVVAKSLVPPAALVAAVPRVKETTASPQNASLAAQRLGDDIFRPPKERIG